MSREARLMETDAIDAQSQPFEIFEKWMKDARENPHINEPTSMALATASLGGEVRVRVVLCKSWSERDGFVFYTNYTSRKGHDLEANPNAAAVFFWDPLFLQIKISGRVERLPRQESIDYWASRPRDSQISGYVSRQSEAIPSREHMEQAWREAQAKFEGREIPCPENWGGYRLRPKTMEFWIGRHGRFHDRHEFEKTISGWTYRRLCP